MGTEQSVQISSGLPELNSDEIKLKSTSDLQPDGETSADEVWRPQYESFVEDVMRGYPAKLQKSEAQSTKEIPPSEAEGRTFSGSNKENLRLITQEQDKTDGFSVPAETTKAQALQQNNQKGHQPTSVPESVMDTVVKSKMPSESITASSCTGDTTKGTEAQLRDLTSPDKGKCMEQAHEVNVGGQTLDCISAHHVSYPVYRETAVIGESELSDPIVMTLFTSEAVFVTDETMNSTEGDLRMPAAKTWPKALGAKEPSFIKDVCEAFPDEPTLAESKTQKGVSYLGEERLLKAGAHIFLGLKDTPVAQQAETVTKDADKFQAYSGDLHFPVFSEKLIDDEDKLFKPLVSEKKKRFCCTVL